ncbi:MAG TPA: hypothetical protein VHT34_02695 [Clostridia bacterium]|nr:hypothetical protein [Clostridia bacterium]
MEKPENAKKDLKLSKLDRKILLAYSGMPHETDVKPTKENTVKK